MAAPDTTADGVHDGLPETARLPRDASWRLEGQLVEASNVVLRLIAGNAEDAAKTGDTDGADDAPRAVYKPVRGERPLADFPGSTLAHREVATFLVAHALGLPHVPETTWYDGDFGPGSLQRWVGPLVPQEQEHVALLDEDEFTARHAENRSPENPGLHAIAAFEGEDGPLVLAHTDDDALRAVAVLDVITNNADRKGSHLVDGDDGVVHAIDNGLTFHVDDKLRTVLWGFAGEPLGDELTAALQRLVTRRAALDEALAPHLSVPEIAALHTRTDALLTAGVFPEPPAERYGLPWPPL